MSPRRVFVGWLSAVTLAASGVFLPASPAYARVGFINVQDTQAVSKPTDVGLVFVAIDSSSVITSMTVSIYQNGSDKLNLPMSDFLAPSNDGNRQWGLWVLANPITTSQLPLGQYNTEVTATDAGGDSVTSAEAGPLYFENEVLFSRFRSSGRVFNYARPDVTFSGEANLLAPGGTPVPFANQTLELTGTNKSINTSVTTDPAGGFRLTVQAQNAVYWTEYPGDATTETQSSATPQIVISTTQSQATIHAHLASPHVNKGSKDSVRGVITYIDNGPKPVPSQVISLYKGLILAGNKPTATTVTNRNGSFTMPITTSVSGWWTLVTPSSPFLIGSRHSLFLSVVEPNEITGFRAQVDSFGVVRFSGCITGVDNGQGHKVELEYAAKKAGPWRALDNSFAIPGQSCRQGRGHGILFSGRAIARLAAAYYRTRYFVSWFWQGAVSKALFLYKHLTRITSFNVTPRRVPVNGTIAVSGRLWAGTGPGRWRPYSHRRVIVVFRYQGVWYRYRSAPKTNAAGWFTGTFKVYVSSPFFAQYNGDSTHFASASKRIQVTATAMSSALGVSVPGAIRQSQVWRSVLSVP